jgi:predicted dehydrogenase
MVAEPRIRAGFIGCGSHACRNLLPAFAFAPVRLIATCDLDAPKAEAAAGRFAAERSYSDYHEMLDREELDAVFVCTSYDERGRPRYPGITIDCLRAGCHVWIEKPPASSVGEIEAMQAASKETGRHVLVGFKKMFAPANEKAKALAESEGFGPISLVTAQYPQAIPTVEELSRYVGEGQAIASVTGFLDHLCHPISLLIFLLGMPETLFYRRSRAGNGVATFGCASGAVAALALTSGAAGNAGMERTMILGAGGQHIVVDNNIRVYLHRSPPHRYGRSPDYFTGSPADVTALWEPEFSLGQLYNKGLFLLGYYNEIDELARSVLESRPPAKGTLEQAWQVTRIFEAFAEGSDRLIRLPPPGARGAGPWLRARPEVE